MNAYKNPLTEKMLWKVLENGGTIGGSSAGATIQGSFLVRVDTRNNQVMMDDHQEGFIFLKQWVKVMSLFMTGNSGRVKGQKLRNYLNRTDLLFPARRRQIKSEGKNSNRVKIKSTQGFGDI